MSSRRTKRKQYLPKSTPIGSRAVAPQTDQAVQFPLQKSDSDGPGIKDKTTEALVTKTGFSGALESETSILWLRRADQLLLGFLLISLVILLVAFRWKLSGGGREEIEIASQLPREYFYALDINRASWVEWAQLDGIGEKLARRIVAERVEHGPFRSVDDVGRVRGIGPKVLERLRPYLKYAIESDQVKATSDREDRSRERESRTVKELR